MTSWQTAIDALRSRDFGEGDDEYEAPTEATRQRALAWMEARSFTDPIRWPTRVDATVNGGVLIDFREGRELRLQVEFENLGSDDWYEYRDGRIIATGQIALPEAEINVTELCVMCGEPCLSVACADCQKFSVESVQPPIALPEGEAGIGPPVGQQTAGGF